MNPAKPITPDHQKGQRKGMTYRGEGAEQRRDQGMQQSTGGRRNVREAPTTHKKMQAAAVYRVGWTRAAEACRVVTPLHCAIIFFLERYELDVA